MKHILPVLFAALTSTAFAQSSDWVEVGGNRDISILFKKGTGERSANRAGEQFTSFIGQWVNKSTGKVEILKFYVTDNDCARGYGELTILTLSNEVFHRQDVALNGRSVASTVATIICEVANSSAAPAPAPAPSSRLNPNAI